MTNESFWAVCCGVVMFLWGAVSHMALGLGDTGIQSLPSEDKVLGVMRENIKDGGFIFPGQPEEVKSENKTADAATKAWTTSSGRTARDLDLSSGRQRRCRRANYDQLVTDIAVALVVAFLLGRSPAR